MAPLLGLLGTVLGMIDIFSSFTSSGMTGNAGMLAGGIGKALICTASGLTVAIPAIFFHRYLQTRVDELVVGMEQEAIKLVEVVQGDRDVDLTDAKPDIKAAARGEGRKK
jgi:biopolymer transport protein ExbB